MQESPNFCPNCGEELEGNPNFCKNCGYDLQKNEVGENGVGAVKDILKQSLDDKIDDSKKFNKVWAHILIGFMILILNLLSIFLIIERMQSFYSSVSPISVVFVICLTIAILNYTIKINLMTFKKDSITIDDILLKDKSFFKRIGSLIGTSIIVIIVSLIFVFFTYWLLLTGGMGNQALIFAGIIVGIIGLFVESKFILSPILAIAEDLGPLSAVTANFKITAGKKMFKMVAVMLLISLIGSAVSYFPILNVLVFPLTFYILTYSYFEIL